MKQLLLISFLFNTSFAFSQSNAMVHQKIFNYLNDSCHNFIGFGCGYVGKDSKNLLCINELIYDRRTDLIQQLLHSEIISTRYLAAEALLMFEKEIKWKMDSTSASAISQLRTSPLAIPFCLGCMRGFSYSSSALLNRNKRTPYKSVRLWMKESLRYSKRLEGDYDL